MAGEGIYIYSIIRRTKDRILGRIGINNQEVTLVRYKDIAAVVSSTPIIHFDRLDKTELTRYVATHQKVNEEIMSHYDIVPLSFGIIAPHADDASRMLEKAYLQFKMALGKVGGNVEFVIHVWWDQKRVLEELVGADTEIQELQQQVSSKDDILGMPPKLTLGALVHQKIEAKKQEYIKDIYTTLRAIARDATVHALVDEDMIANLSILLEKKSESKLDKKMHELGKKYDGTLRFKYIGPTAAYSFCTINLGLGNFEIVNEARKLLQLEEEVTFDEIKKAYYALSHVYHPDTSDGDFTTTEKMKKIIEAYRVLENYRQSCDTSMRLGKNTKYSLKRKDVENTFIVKK